MHVDNKPIEFGRKAPKRTLGLLKAIIAFGGKGVPEQRLADALWPELEGDAAHELVGTVVAEELAHTVAEQIRFGAESFELVGLAEKSQHAVAHETGRRLVENEQPGTVCERGRKRGFHAHAMGKVAQPAIRRQVELLHQIRSERVVPRRIERLQIFNN